ncbi:OsmC family protein [Denitromonas iodatirespirans]|uniref:OsmC family protein n=1 Tax=Denitromonas iodatirespirans TaxID=2795389 RepID=A0A944DCA3_DENI1|nr:OsmC family protein [Denitromonas iodatirespirans]MBT0962406.1 OsmC family protein [Denitromonas iodatirespirans]
MHMRNQEERHFGVKMELQEGFRFISQAYEGDRLHGAPFASDEPDPIGEAAAPSTPALLASAVGHCLAASLTEICRHAAMPLRAMAVDAVSVVAPNEEDLPRIRRIDVTLTPTLTQSQSDTMKQRCEMSFRKYCTVCSSLEGAIDVQVRVQWQLERVASTIV